ncbi:uncharacterized protein DDB_G0290685-like [Uranotaenia lowii]|uniref:uncharacterized protein DDB_G0290685-like n=1 Tax=Uranotaenia lowii TaxID=190385 RepID=UPI0024795403|nr:uncharacterized protein DDB_G0290685-like [Uranotaenia lowii]
MLKFAFVVAVLVGLAIAHDGHVYVSKVNHPAPKASQEESAAQNDVISEGAEQRNSRLDQLSPGFREAASQQEKGRNRWIGLQWLGRGFGRRGPEGGFGIEEIVMKRPIKIGKERNSAQQKNSDLGGLDQGGETEDSNSLTGQGGDSNESGEVDDQDQQMEYERRGQENNIRNYERQRQEEGSDEEQRNNRRGNSGRRRPQSRKGSSRRGQATDQRRNQNRGEQNESYREQQENNQFEGEEQAAEQPRQTSRQRQEDTQRGEEGVRRGQESSRRGQNQGSTRSGQRNSWRGQAGTEQNTDSRQNQVNIFEDDEGFGNEFWRLGQAVELTRLNQQQASRTQGNGFQTQEPILSTERPSEQGQLVETNSGTGNPSLSVESRGLQGYQYPDSYSWHLQNKLLIEKNQETEAQLDNRQQQQPNNFGRREQARGNNRQSEAGSRQQGGGNVRQQGSNRGRPQNQRSDGEQQQQRNQNNRQQYQNGRFGRQQSEESFAGLQEGQFQDGDLGQAQGESTGMGQIVVAEVDENQFDGFSGSNTGTGITNSEIGSEFPEIGSALGQSEESQPGDEDYSYPKYKYEYGVRDYGSGDHKTQWEIRDGDVVKGQYVVLQPDGIHRIVKYTSDNKNGFEAEVQQIGAEVSSGSPSEGSSEFQFGYL